MENRFSEKNVYWKLSSLVTQSNAQSAVDSTLLHPLHVCAGTAANDESLRKTMLLKKCANETDLSTVCKHMQEYTEAFPVLHKLYITAFSICNIKWEYLHHFTTVLNLYCIMLHMIKWFWWLVHEKSMNQKHFFPWETRAWCCIERERERD